MLSKLARQTLHEMASSSDYLAIVFAGGRGNRMTALTDHMSKAKLPVANLPLYWYPLSMLSRNGFTECILVVQREEHSSIKESLQKLPQFPTLNVELVSFGDSNDEEEVEDWGTADVLKQMLDKLKRKGKENILLVTGDLVSDICLDEMLKQHSESQSILTCLLTDSALGGPVPGSKERIKKYRDFAIISPESRHLFFLVDEDDYAEEDGIPTKLFLSSPHLLCTAKYKDVHLYAIQRCALEILANEKLSSEMSSIKADLIPQLLEAQYSRRRMKSLFNDPQKQIKCLAYIPAKESFSIIAQCNNVGAYFEANKAIQKLLAQFHPDITKTRQFDKTATGVNCIESSVSEGARIGDKCQIKRSVIGDQTLLGKGAKVDNSILMPGASIQDGATVKNCIVFGDTVVGEKADVAMCIIGPRQKVANKEKLANMTLIEEKEMNMGD